MSHFGILHHAVVLKGRADSDEPVVPSLYPRCLNHRSPIEREACWGRDLVISEGICSWDHGQVPNPGARKQSEL